MNRQQFHHPGKEYREVPFWSWNDDLDPAELRRQIGLMDKAGWGGFFMHSRVGLKTPYLGKKWMECIRASVEEARKRGMDAWLYDEDKWPSGFAGGLAAVKPEHRAMVLVCLVDNKPALLEERLATFSALRQHGSLEDFQPLGDLQGFDGDSHSLIQFYPLRQSLGVTWFNGYTYINPLNPEAVKAFLESTHEVYAREIGAEFGKTIPGIFTDEPAYMSANMPDIGVVAPGSLQAVPWVEGMEDLFQVRWGYDLLPCLPSLFFDQGEFHAVRYHFWRLVTERFVEAYTKQIYEWCEAHQLQLTGHYLLEDSMWFMTRWIGAAMPHYEYEHIPGIDKLARNLYTPLTVKQVDSAACQLGKARVLCESYGAAGQDFSFTGRKWIGDWLYVLGVNLNNPHLSLYSMRGERKRDYPANLFFQQPWWPENRLIADYFARLSYALSQGQRVVDVLVLHPQGSAWSLYHPDAYGAAGKLDEALVQLEKTLLNAQRDFHYGDEMLMEKYARVAEGEEGQPLFQIGQMSYHTVIVPPSVTWNRNTVRLLAEFGAAGGTILAVRPLPERIEGMPAEAVLPPQAQAVEIDGLIDALDTTTLFDVRLENCPEVWIHHRRVGQNDIYFLANTSLENSYQARLLLRESGRLEEWNPVDGSTWDLAQETGGTRLDFAPTGSHLLVLHRGEAPNPAPETAEAKARAEVTLESLWQIELDGPNALPLEWPRYRINGGGWHGPLYILDAQKQVAAAGLGSEFIMEFSVDIESVPHGPLHLVVESPQRYSIRVNGKNVSNADAGSWVDGSFRKIDIHGLLEIGSNTFELSGRLDRESELEPVYLIGSFGIYSGTRDFEGSCSGQEFFRYSRSLILGKTPKHVACTDLAHEGLPCYAGRVHASQSLRLEEQPARAVLALEHLQAALVHLRVNGQDAGWVAWPPHRFDLGSLLKAGENTLELEMVNTLRNLCGPHHIRGGDPEGVGPESFRSGPAWTDETILVPFGFESARLILY